LNLIGVPSADVGGIHHRLKSAASRCTAVFGYCRLADGQKIRAKTADRLFEDDLEETACDEGVGQAKDGARGIVEGQDVGIHLTGRDLAEEDYADGEEGAEKTGGWGGGDFRYVYIGEGRIDDVARSGECEGQISDACWVDCPELNCTGD